MKTVDMALRAEREPGAEEEVLFADAGANRSAACRMSPTRAVQGQRIPSDVRRPDRKTLRALADAERGKGLSGCFDSVDELMEDLNK